MGADDSVILHLGDCLDVLAEMEPDSVDTIITDPPYGLEFMGKDWDNLTAVNRANRGTQTEWKRPPNETSKAPKFRSNAPAYDLSNESQFQMQLWHQRWAKAALRVAKPGAMLLAFGGTRTHHRLMCAIEDAGWEIRDVLMWVYGSGFPKSHDISKAIDKAAGAEREVVGQKVYAGGHVQNSSEDKLAPPIGTFKRTQDRRDDTAPATNAAAEWDGWGTALKPAYEPIILAMKPRDGTFANNALVHGVAGLWIDGARVPTNGENITIGFKGPILDPKDGWNSNSVERTPYDASKGRWPANLILDEEAGAMLDEMSGESSSSASMRGERAGNIYGGGKGPSGPDTLRGHNDTGGASRFFYCPKASRAERNAGLEGMPKKSKPGVFDDDNYEWNPEKGHRIAQPTQNHHPTVKPVALLEYLCRLTRTPTGGIVLDPFMGSGSTGIACVNEGRDFIGIELDADYFEIARRRIEHAQQNREPEQLELMPC